MKVLSEKYKKAEKFYNSTNVSLREVSRIFNVNRHDLSNLIKSKGNSTRKKIDVEDTIFEKIDCSEKAYWLGFLYADGCVIYKQKPPTRYCIELSLQESDKNHLEKFLSFLKTSKKLKYREKQKAYRILILSKKMCEDLIKLGCVPNKSLILTFPDSNILPNIYLRDFMRGYFDGDGSISISKTTNVLTNLSLIGTKEFLSSLLDKLNLKNTPLKKDSRWKNNTFYISLSVKDAFMFLNFMYNDSELYLDRKHYKYLLAVEHRNILDNKRTKTVKSSNTLR